MVNYITIKNLEDWWNENNNSFTNANSPKTFSPKEREKVIGHVKTEIALYDEAVGNHLITLLPDWEKDIKRSSKGTFLLVIQVRLSFHLKESKKAKKAHQKRLSELTKQTGKESWT